MKKGETITELAARHLKDRTHTTSDEEIKNAQVEIDEQPASGTKSLFEIDNTTVFGEVESNDNSSTEANDDKDSSPNPYDVIA